MAAKIQKVFIANRGEIALRVIRACRDLGIKSVVCYSDADAASLPVRMADEAISLGGFDAKDSYLNVSKLINAIKATKADAVHPGYGFLSENSQFAEEIQKIGVKFIGPSPKSMDMLGDKVKAKKLMIEHKIPTVPGSYDALSNLDELLICARDVGFPMILKAAAGGGGRGMRVVRKTEELAASFSACQREALAYFGNAAIFCERYIEHPRHIEFQVLFDSHGQGIHLFERDCSIQRRHQKLIEEAPSIYLSAKQRENMGNIAVRAAQAAQYEGAGTIEFICESPDQFYFMEMNTRIQVEHTVTEEITGIDLVKAQIEIADGKKLQWKQEDVSIRGHSIQLRINAEDPSRQFTPCPGLVRKIKFPHGPGIRVDSHLLDGYEIPKFYDSMIAKLIVSGRTREETINRTKRALLELEIDGVTTTARFHELILSHPRFLKSDFTTRFMEEEAAWLDDHYKTQELDELDAIMAALILQKSLPETQLISETTNQTNLWQQRALFESIGV